ncbi:flavin reductase family protein [Zobellella aerophila]|uniref:Flavin reductase family protein n=1 Tax=Zobellella aerophila TaxID=870480 RepID=A0ABP6UZV7_9GAMM
MSSATTVLRQAEQVTELAPPVDTRALRNAMGHFATGVTVVTAPGEGNAMVGITANSFSSLSLEPPLVLWSLALSSPNLASFVEGKPFAVNVLGQGQEAVAMQFSGARDDKFAGIDYRLNQQGVPLLASTLARFECRVEFTRRLGDHLLIVGRVKDFSTDEGEPMLFYKGRFGALDAAAS